MMPFFLFLGLRLADVTTTYLNMAKYDGWGAIEAVPFNAWLVDTYGFLPLAGINLVISLALYAVMMRVVPRLYWVVVGIISLVVLNNTLIYVFI